MNATLHWRALSLADGGRSLVEASAGTGKTWTIAVLYLRLLLERDLSPRQIVVTTFTDAAADELRERLRGKLMWALELAEHPAPTSEDQADDLRWLLARWQSQPARDADHAKLRLALTELDAAPVSTLHGLCRRILADHPFACGLPFALGDLVAQTALLHEVTDDLWRCLQQGAERDELVQCWLAAEPALRLHRGKFAAGLAICLKPGVSVAHANLSADAIGEALPAAWGQRLRAVLARDMFGAASKLPRFLAQLCELIESQGEAPVPADLAKELRIATKLTGAKKAVADDEELKAVADFAAGCADFVEDLAYLPQRRFWQRMADEARRMLDERLLAREQLTFDDLLTKVYDALQRERATPASRPLADALFNAWPVALVDEFQDTDAVQYGILDAIYRDQDGAARGRLLMIGDPKQAIYRFRGGDIHAYLRAAAQADAGDRMTLDVNHRSSRAMVSAINAFYRQCGEALTAVEPPPQDAIVYLPVKASGRRDAEPYASEGVECTQPLVIHYDTQQPDSKPARRDHALEACANQIASMLHAGTHRIGARSLEPSDIAVLVPANKDVSDLRERLARRGVPSVSSSRSSVFETEAARELQILLHALLHPEEPGSIRAAAATRLWGMHFSELLRAGDDPAIWQPITQTFHAWQQAWLQRGIQSVVEALIERIAQRALATQAGERWLTDLRHLGELLQEQSRELPGPQALLAWLAQSRGGGDGAITDEAAKATLLRIESDRPRVRIMTLHASKGLEFNIVMLPLMWAHDDSNRNAPPLFLIDDDSGTRFADLGARASERERADLQDERMRVLYVALTRAIHACHIYAMPPDRPSSARSAKPAEGYERSALDVMLSRASERLPPDASPIAWEDGWPPDNAIMRAVAEASEPLRVARPMPSRRPGPMPARHSFTTLSRHEGPASVLDPDASALDEREALADAGADDAAWLVPVLPELADEPPHPALSALAPVRGADFGNALHAIMEHRVIGRTLREQPELVMQELQAAGVRSNELDLAELAPLLITRLDQVIGAPLGLHDAVSFCLGDLKPAQIRAEMEFHFRLDYVSMSALQRACADHGEPTLVPAQSRTLLGLMNGKIDLLFEQGGRVHVLDYKGNYLGEQLADYRGQALVEAMNAHDYRFQALIYTIALERYLHQRLGDAYRRERHLGECVYLFMRAVGLEEGAGIWRHRFDPALLDAVADVFAGTLEDAA